MASAPALHDVVIVTFDGFQMLDLVGPWEVFNGATELLAGTPTRRGYGLTAVSVDGGAIRSSSGLTVETTRHSAGRHPIATLVLPGGDGVRRAAADPTIVDMVGDLARRAERVATVCSGTFLAAATGLADGKRVTTHWARAERLAATYPTITVDPDPIYVRDGDLWSSAGVTAGIDLALALVEHDHDADLAQTVARWMVMFLRRPGGQTQFAAPVWSERAVTPPVRVAQELIEAAPADDHRVGVLADRVGMSERHFVRCFAAETGSTPARYVAAIRLESARRDLETTADTVDVVARRCGFGTGESMRRTFARDLGVSPDQYRQRFSRRADPHSPPTPSPQTSRSSR